MNIHPTAIISKEAQIGEDVTIGPYSILVGKVKIGRGTQISSHVTIGQNFGYVEIGEDNKIFPGAVIGTAPQDLSYRDEETGLKIGDKNMIREFCTINLGTQRGGGITVIGNQNMLMAYVHVAHDCKLGDRIVIANETHFAGHVEVENDVKIGGGCLINQFCKLGQHAYIAGDSTINKDIIPFSMAQGKYAIARASNKIGMERAGFSPSDIENIHRAIRYLIKGDRTVAEAIEKIKADCEPTSHVQALIDFVTSSQRGIAR